MKISIELSMEQEEAITVKSLKEYYRAVSIAIARDDETKVNSMRLTALDILLDDYLVEDEYLSFMDNMERIMNNPRSKSC